MDFKTAADYLEGRFVQLTTKELLEGKYRENLHEAMRIGGEVLRKAEQYKWHDLNANPTNLPPVKLARVIEEKDYFKINETTHHQIYESDAVLVATDSGACYVAKLVNEIPEEYPQEAILYWDYGDEMWSVELVAAWRYIDKPEEVE